MSTPSLRYRCGGCDRAEQIKAPESPSAGSADSRARVRGWRFPPRADNEDRKGICPECTGDNETYWDDRTLAIAYQSGIDVGNTAWGGEGHA